MRIVKIKDCGKVITGNTPSKKNKEYYNSDDINFFTPSDLENNKITKLDKSINYISNEAKEKARIIPEKSVLTTCIGIIGKVGINQKESAFNQQINAIIPDDTIINNRYLAYSLIAKAEYLKKKANAPVVPIMNKTDFENIEINLVELNKQIEIVEILDIIQKQIDLNSEQIELLDKLIKCKFSEKFGSPIINDKKWECKRLCELGNFKNGMNYNKNNQGYKIKFLSVSDFKNGNFIDNVDVLQELNLSEKPSEEYLLKNEDIVFVRSNGSKELVGRSILLKNIDMEVTYSGFCIRYRNENTNITTAFLIQLFQNEEFKIQLKKDSRGANINNINQQMLSNLKIILPPIELQNEFEKVVNKIEKQKEKYQEQLNEAKELMNTLMDKYFN